MFGNIVQRKIIEDHRCSKYEPQSGSQKKKMKEHRCKKYEEVEHDNTFGRRKRACSTAPDTHNKEVRHQGKIGILDIGNKKDDRSPQKCCYIRLKGQFCMPFPIVMTVIIMKISVSVIKSVKRD